MPALNTIYYFLHSSVMLGVNREISYCNFPSCTIVQETENCQTCLYCTPEPDYDKQTWSGNVRNCSDWVLNIDYHSLHSPQDIFDLVWFCFMQGLREICCFFACFHRVALVMFLWVVSLLSKIAAIHFRPAFMAADCTCRQSRYGTIILQAAEVDYFPNRLYDMTCLQ